MDEGHSLYTHTHKLMTEF